MTKKKAAVISYFILLTGCLSGLLNSAGALISGFLITLVFGNYFEGLKSTAINWLLKAAVVGLGFGMFIGETLKTGREGFWLTFFTIFSTLVLGILLTKVLKLDRKLGFMVSSGTSICGGSAIAAVSSVIKAPAGAVSIALGVVFFLNAIALFIFPPIGHYLNLSQQQFGLWAAVAIHDTSSVVGAALDYGQEALKIAATVKLARALWIIPVSVLSMALFKQKGGRVKVPWFIFLFVIAILINSYLHLPINFTDFITSASRKLLVATLFLIGSMLSIKDIKETGLKPFMIGVILWIFVSASSLYLIMNVM